MDKLGSEKLRRIHIYLLSSLTVETVLNDRDRYAAVNDAILITQILYWEVTGVVKKGHVYVSV